LIFNSIKDKIAAFRAPPRPSEADLEQMPANELYALGGKYFAGAATDRIRPDPSYAVDLFRRSRAKGFPLAAYSLAMMKLEDSPARDFVRDEEGDPVATLQRLAEAGVAHAQFNLGLFHMYGRYGMRKDPVRAIAFFEMAARQGDIQAPYNLYLLFQERGELESSMKWLKHAADMADLNAQYFLANWLNVGNPFLGPDQEKALRLWEAAAEKGHASASHNAGMAYLQGSGCEEDGRKAIRFLKIASDLDYLPSKMNLAHIYLEGLIVPADVPSAVVLLTEVSVSGQNEFEALRQQAAELKKELEREGKIK